MSDRNFINFTYNSPHEDVEKAIGHNSDSTLNVKYTLTSLQYLLQHNLGIIEKLLEHQDVITNINSLGYNSVEIEISSPEVVTELCDSGVLVKHVDPGDSDASENILSDDEETNAVRYTGIANLINQNDNRVIFDKLSSDSESDKQDIVNDDLYVASIVDKYYDYLENSDDDSGTLS